MRFIPISLFAFLWLPGALNTAAADITLVQENKTDYVIALAGDAIPAEKTAARQLQKYLREVTGAELRIQDENAVAADSKQILVGPGRRVKSILPREDWASLGNDGIIVRTLGNKLILAGGRPRGTIYAVYQFLEDEVGCRWWTPTERSIPRRETLTVAEQNVRYVPVFTYRQHFAVSVSENAEFATIMRENGHEQPQGEEWGGHHTLLGNNHTFSKLLPVDRYFDEHPEWFSDPANGFKPATRQSAKPQQRNAEPCLGNPEVVETITNNALQWVRDNPQAGYISISQNDNLEGYCRDGYATSLVEREGTAAAPLIDFVNKVAARIHKEFPHFLVETLAYNYSEKAPKTIRPAENVIVRIAPINTDFGRPYTSAQNAAVRQNIEAWAAISSQLFIWNYATNFYETMLPHPNLHNLGADLRYFASRNVTSLFQQGDNYTNGVGDFVQLRDWLMGRLMWNPQLDQDALMNEFLTGYYGGAAPHLRRYLDLIHEAFLARNRKLTLYNQDFSFLDLDTTNQCVALFDKALAAVKDDEVLTKRVQRERLSLEIARLYRFDELTREAQQRGLKLLGDPDKKQAMERFIAASQAFGVRRFSEYKTFDEALQLLRAMAADPTELPEPLRDIPRDRIVDIQSAQFRLFDVNKLSFVEQDEKASDKEAASIIGDTTEWSIQAQLGQVWQHVEAGHEAKWHVYAMTRVQGRDGIPPDEIVFRTGIYDDIQQKWGLDKAVSAAETGRDGYKLLDMGVHPLNGGMIVWFAPVRNPAIEKLYVDRVILVRQ